MSSSCQFFCRIHGMCDASSVEVERAPSKRLICGLGLLGALMLAVLGATLPGALAPQHLVPWSALWLSMFPAFSRVAPRHAFACALFAATLTPLALLVFRHAEVAASPWSSLVFLTLPLYVAALAAALVARLVAKLDRRAQAAQGLGVYQLESRIGQGGMGEVWKARHALLSRPAAIKLIKPKQLADGSEVVDDAAKRRFEQEAQTTASLQSPHTVELYDFGATSTGTFYYVMELLEGDNLEELVEREGPLAPERVVGILRQVLDSLAEAHDRGLVHRDIKPANIVVSRRGLHEDFVKVLDFGLAQAAEHVQSELKRSGKVLGTPAYLAPEAITLDGPIDARADIYALGCVAYWLLTGTLVFSGKTVTQMAVAHAVETPEPPSQRLGKSIGWDLEKLVLQCLAKDPEQRPSSALELMAQLESLQERAGSGEYPARLPSREHSNVRAMA